MNKELIKKSQEIRRSILVMLEHAGSGHSGGSLSATDIITALYYAVMRNTVPKAVSPRDHFILSKGHAAPALYAVLADKGFFPEKELMTLRQLHSRLQGHPDSKKCPGVEISTGSLGQGVSVATGLALAIKTRKEDERVYVLIGDGESDEGLVWEAAQAAAHFKLDNLYVIIDRNNLQLDGTTAEIMDTRDLAEKYKAFGFRVSVINGHNFDQILTAFHAPIVKGVPNCIIANTIKGKGVSFMENKVSWHGNAPNTEQLITALCELEN